MSRLFTFISLVAIVHSSMGQGLFTPSSAQLKVGSSVQLKVGGNMVNRGQVYDEGVIVVDGNVDNSSRFNISNDVARPATLDANGNINNTGNLENVGLILLGGDWVNTGIYNGIDGELEFDGATDQTFTNGVVDLNSLTINSEGVTLMRGDTVRVLGQINFVNGYLDSDPGTFLIIEDGAEVLGGSDNSYSQGTLYQRGLGYRFFPVGNLNLYLPVYLENVFGQEPLIGVNVGSFAEPPIPDRLLLGISEAYYWDIQTVRGTFDSSRVTVDYVDADILNSTIRNNIAYESATPALAESEALDEPFTNLFTTDDSIEDPDQFSSGVITGDIAFTKRYLAVALSPKIPEDGVSYIPTAFSPASANDEDRVLKFYGEKVIAEGFSLKIYDRRGMVMYETADIADAKALGWDGLLRNGKEASGGYYFYSAKFEFENGRRVSKTGEILLIR